MGKHKPSVSDEHKCNICDKTYARRDLLASHIETHNPGHYPCDRCDYVATVKKYLGNHIRRTHLRVMKEQCDFCGKGFWCKSKMQQHRLVHTGEKPFQCKSCGKAFNTPYSLNTHKLIHTNEKPFKCKYCPYACRDCSTLRKHQHRHNGIVQVYKCTTCGSTFTKKEALRVHVAEKHLKLNVHILQCPHCEKKFKMKQQLRTHVKYVHTHPKEHKCEICGKLYSGPSNLKQHILTHADSRPHRCPYLGCTKMFKIKGDMQRHYIIHTNDRRHRCDICGKGFYRPFHLRQHVKTHTPRRRKVQCDYCKEWFYSKNYIIKHIGDKHNANKQLYECDTCGFRCRNKPGLVMHLKKGHEKEELECKICHYIYKRHMYLKLHYLKTHGIRYKMKQRRPPIEIKEEPADEIDLFEVEKQEPEDIDELDLETDSALNELLEAIASNKDSIQEIEPMADVKEPLVDIIDAAQKIQRVLEPEDDEKDYRDEIDDETDNNEDIIDRNVEKGMFSRDIDKHKEVEGSNEVRDEEIHKEIERINVENSEVVRNVDVSNGNSEMNKRNELPIDKIGENEKLDVNFELKGKEKLNKTNSKNNKSSGDTNSKFNNNEVRLDQMVSTEDYCDINDKDEICLEEKNEINRKETSIQCNKNDGIHEVEIETLNEENIEAKSTKNYGNDKYVIESEIFEDKEKYEEISQDSIESSKDKIKIIQKDKKDKNESQDCTKTKETRIKRSVKRKFNKYLDDYEIPIKYLKTNKSKKGKQVDKTIEEIYTNNFETPLKLLKNSKHKTNKAKNKTKNPRKDILKDKTSGKQTKNNNTLKFEVPLTNKDEKAFNTDETKMSTLNDVPSSLMENFCALQTSNTYRQPILHTVDEPNVDQDIKKEMMERVKTLLAEGRQKNQVKSLEQARRQYNIRIRKALNKPPTKEKLKVEYFKKKATLMKEIEDTASTKSLDDIANENDSISEESDKESNKDASEDEANKTYGLRKNPKKKIFDKEDESVENSDNDFESDCKKKGPNKVNFNSHQCYVCFKLFKTKAELLDHCKDHFDVCSEKILKKCPLCSYVTNKSVVKHMKIKHNVNIKINYARIKDKKENSDGCRYYYEIDNEKVNRIEVIPSIKNLNKLAMLKIDKKQRNDNDTLVVKNKLVKKGKEWVVETQKVNIKNEYTLPKFDEKDLKKVKIGDNSDVYLDNLKKLYHVAKKSGQKMLFPCQHCEKICQNMSALKLHSRKHNPNAKPFRKKVWKHKLNDSVVNKKTDKTLELDTDEKLKKHREEKPQPIKNNHHCDPELKEFYEKNIRGGDIEFWQFLKIHNKMSRENIKDFKDLEGRYEYGMDPNISKHTVPEFKTKNTKNDAIVPKTGNDNNISINIKNGNGKNGITKSVTPRNCYKRVIRISKKEFLKRNELKQKLRESIANDIRKAK